jgi:filamentous hemagglutinin family protein
MTSRIPAHLLCSALLSPLVLLLSLDAAAAAPSGGAISVASATVSPSANVTLQTNSAVPNWQGFTITGNVAALVQPAASGATLNRISGGTINVTGATISGTLQSNPPVTLINPSGVVIQAASQLPTGGSVNTGSASFNVQGNVLTVTNSSGAVINWQDFSIGSGATTNFVQPSTSSVVLNRVVGQNASTIGGTLSSNGRVFLANPNGALFTSGAQINTAGLTATTSTISNAEFLAGRNGSTGSGSSFSVDAPLSVRGGALSITNSTIDVTASLITPGNLTFTTPQSQTGGGTPLIPSNPSIGTGVLPVLISPAVLPLMGGTSVSDIQTGNTGTAFNGAVGRSSGDVTIAGGRITVASGGSSSAGGQPTGTNSSGTVALTGTSASVASAPPRVAAATFTLQKREPMF